MYGREVLVLANCTDGSVMVPCLQQPDSERGQTSRNGSSSKRATISSNRPSSSGEPRLVSSSQRIQPGIELKPSSFSRAAPTKGTRDDPLRSFEFLSIRK